MNEYMRIALEQAKKGARRGEVPVGAVLVRDGKVIAKAHNKRERKQNALAHAECLVINRACRKLRSWRLDDCVMYVTLQPCIMCAGAILNARIKTLVVGALASDKGGVDSLEIYSKNNLNWKTDVVVQECEECSAVLKNFFAEKRN
jgi:tRNA(adenine34) deaminase